MAAALTSTTSLMLVSAAKGPNIATLEVQTGALTSLFTPRTDRWSEHFRLDGAVIAPLTPVGRGTAMLLRFNDEQRIALRAELMQQGRYSPPPP